MNGQFEKNELLNQECSFKTWLFSFKILQVKVSLTISASYSEFTKLRTIHKSVWLLTSNLSVRAPWVILRSFP